MAKARVADSTQASRIAFREKPSLAAQRRRFVCSEPAGTEGTGAVTRSGGRHAAAPRHARPGRAACGRHPLDNLWCLRIARLQASEWHALAGARRSQQTVHHFRIRGESFISQNVTRFGRFEKPGISQGETGDSCDNITQDPMHVHDLQVPILHCLGIDHTRLTYKFQGRDFRLTDAHGAVVSKLLV